MSLTVDADERGAHARDGWEFAVGVITSAYDNFYIRMICI